MLTGGGWGASRRLPETATKRVRTATFGHHPEAERVEALAVQTDGSRLPSVPLALSVSPFGVHRPTGPAASPGMGEDGSGAPLPLKALALEGVVPDRCRPNTALP